MKNGFGKAQKRFKNLSLPKHLNEKQSKGNNNTRNL